MDAAAALGVATTRVEERVLASLGQLGAAAIRLERADDVPAAGVLCALPALLALGLLRHSQQYFQLPPGFYSLASLFLTLAFTALARVRSLEALRYEAPGEWGKILGLDRVPEVKTLRGKVAELAADETKVRQWSSTLAQEWLAASAAEAGAGTLYVDGHVRVYHGSLTALPRRYVARQKLCLRGTTDYWVNAMDGRPFFVVSQPVDPGMITVLEDTIVPRLLQDVPGQPTPAQLEAEPWRARFTLVFDRAGYSPDFFQRMWAQRLAVVSYHKFPGAAWEESEFATGTVRLVSGEEVSLRLAERGTRLSNGQWVREIRSLDERAHQTAMLTTDFTSARERVAVTLFARWCQENFFQYMSQHYGLDHLVAYGTEPLPDTTRVVHPAWRRADAAVRRQRALLRRAQAELGAQQLTSTELAPAEVAAYEQAQGQRLEQVRQQAAKLAELKAARQALARHVLLKELPASERFAQLKTIQKHFVDTLKLIAYRAESALVLVAREKLARRDDGRALIREVLRSAADLRPDETHRTLTVRLHRLASATHDAALEHLCAELTATETVYPGTDLRLIYEPVGATPLPRGQES